MWGEGGGVEKCSTLTRYEVLIGGRRNYLARRCLSASESSEVVREKNGGRGERGGRRKFIPASYNTHSCPAGDKIDFVEDIDDLLRLFLLGEVVFDGMTPCPERVTGIEDVEDDV